MLRIGFDTERHPLTGSENRRLGTSGCDLSRGLECPSTRAALVALLSLITCGCITGYQREAPMAVYPAGELSGPPQWFLGWRWRW